MNIGTKLQWMQRNQVCSEAHSIWGENGISINLKIRNSINKNHTYQLIHSTIHRD